MPARHEAGEISCEQLEWSVGRRPERPPAGTIACHTRRSLLVAFADEAEALKSFDAA
jgi:hypothetical protein